MIDQLIKRYTGRIWQAATGEPINAAFPSDLKKIEVELRAFAGEITAECGACMSEPRE